MMNDVVKIVIAPLNWFYALLTASNTLAIFISAIVVFMIVRFLLLPLVGGSFIGREYDRASARSFSGGGRHYNSNKGGGGSSRGGGAGRR